MRWHYYKERPVFEKFYLKYSFNNSIGQYSRNNNPKLFEYNDK